VSARRSAFGHQRRSWPGWFVQFPFTGTDRLAVGAAGGVAGWGLVTQGGVTPVMVVVMFPVADDHPGMVEGPEAGDVEALVAELGVKRFNVAVVPRLSRRDEMKANPTGCQVGHCATN
jgi:hypothetical protein